MSQQQSSKSQTEKKNDGGGAVLIILAIAVVFIVSPGMLIMGVIKNYSGTSLDVGQMWTFAIVIAVCLFGIIALIQKSAWKGLKTYLILCTAIVLLSLLCHFGLKAKWPSEYMTGFFPEDTTSQPKEIPNDN